MREHRNEHAAGGGEPIRRGELESARAASAGAPAQGGSASAAPLAGLIAANAGYNLYTVQLVGLSAGGPPEEIDGEQVAAVNLAEPFDQDGELEADTPVLVWPSQGLYLFCQPRPAVPPSDGGGWWARVVSGGGPTYAVRRQVATGATGFADAEGAEELAAVNVWELSVDDAATADVPADAIVRVFEAPDADETPRRFFFYPIHAVYR